MSFEKQNKNADTQQYWTAEAMRYETDINEIKRFEIPTLIILHRLIFPLRLASFLSSE